MTCGLPPVAQGMHRLVLANILAQPLKLLAPLLCAHAEVGGQLLLAGILERQAEEIAEAYRPWCDLTVLDAEETWVLMGGVRR
jgi:ribosomal protein L11 methyltransferase